MGVNQTTRREQLQWLVVLPYVHGVSEKMGRILKQQKVKVAYTPQQTINSLFSASQRSELDDSGRQKSEYPNYGAQKGSGRFWLKLQSFTAKSTILATTWTLKTSRSLLSKPITTNDFSLKPGTLLWTQTLGTIITYFQKPRRASREHELNGHKRKLTLNSVWQQTSLSYPLMKA